MARIVFSSRLLRQRRVGLWVLFPKQQGEGEVMTAQTTEGISFKTYQADRWEDRSGVRETQPHFVLGKNSWVYTEPGDPQYLPPGEKKSSCIEDRVEILEEIEGGKVREIDVVFTDGATDKGEGTGWEVAGPVVGAYVEARKRQVEMEKAIGVAKNAFDEKREELQRGRRYKAAGAAAVTFFHAERKGFGKWKVEGGYRGTNRVIAVLPPTKGQASGGIVDLQPNRDVFSLTNWGDKTSFRGEGGIEEHEPADIYPLWKGNLKQGTILIVTSDGYGDLPNVIVQQIERKVRSGRPPGEIIPLLKETGDLWDDRSIAIVKLD